LITVWRLSGHARVVVVGAHASESEPSFADMLATLRRLSVRMEVSKMALRGRGARKLATLLENVAAMAA